MREYNYFFEDEYDSERKARYMKKHSAPKNKTSKSKHKHEYIPCGFKVREMGGKYAGAYCKECGKIQDIVRVDKLIESLPVFEINYADKMIDKEQLKNE